jgi:hypothetical protein
MEILFENGSKTINLPGKEISVEILFGGIIG